MPRHDLTILHRTVLARFHADLESERAENVESTQLRLNAIRQMMHQAVASSTGAIVSIVSAVPAGEVLLGRTLGRL